MWSLKPLSLTTDVLVIGGGIAGHQAAVAARRNGAKVMMVYQAKGASPYIIGFNVPMPGQNPLDSPAVYAEDVIDAGARLNERNLVRVVAETAEKALQDLAAIGVPFVKNGDAYAVRHLSGNSQPRSVFHPDGIGKLIGDQLRLHANDIGISSVSAMKAIGLLRSDGRVTGAVFAKKHSNELLAVHARCVILASGGIGGLFEDSTYPSDITGDAYAMALAAGASLIDMEFVQFEPTVILEPQGCRGMEMPTAMLGDGAFLLNNAGERFMLTHNAPHGERQIEKAKLALYIQQEIDAGRGVDGQSVLFDATMLPSHILESYTAHCRRLRNNNLDPALEPVRVRPAAHSQMGGIRIDESGFTGIPGLYAVGEAAGGLHGASRLAGNGASDAIVLSAAIGCAAARAMEDSFAPAAAPKALHLAVDRLNKHYRNGDHERPPAHFKQAVRAIMSRSCGLLRDAERLEAGLAELDKVRNALAQSMHVDNSASALEAVELSNMLIVARSILASAHARQESRGAHQRVDYPCRQDEKWLLHVAVQSSGASDIALAEIPIAADTNYH